MQFKKIKAKDIFNAAVHWIINILIVYIILLLAIGLGKTIFSVTALFKAQSIGEAFTSAVTDILTFFVVIELFRSFIEYFKAQRFRLNNMIDPAIILVVRELIVALYKNDHMEFPELAGFSLLILSLGTVRAMAVRFSPAKKISNTNIASRSAKAA